MPTDVTDSSSRSRPTYRTWITDQIEPPSRVKLFHAQDAGRAVAAAISDPHEARQPFSFAPLAGRRWPTGRMRGDGPKASHRRFAHRLPASWAKGNCSSSRQERPRRQDAAWHKLFVEGHPASLSGPDETRSFDKPKAIPLESGLTASSE